MTIDTNRHIFLSYTRANIQIAAQIRNALENAGHIVWQDVTAIKGGIEWINSIEDGIDRSYAVVSVVSQESQASEWVTIEYLHAVRREKLIVPIKVDSGDIPTMMLTRNVVQGHPDLEQGIQNLIAAMPLAEAAKSSATTSQDRRQLEIDHLDRILLEHSVWQTVYTPMGGLGQMQVETHQDNGIEITQTGVAMESLFAAFWEEESQQEKRSHETRQSQYEDILDAVRDMRQLVILGEPGSGKSTSLWRIASDLSLKAKLDTTAPLPLIIRLGELGVYSSLEEAISKALGDLAPFYSELLKEKRLAFLLDGLNEMPSEKKLTFVQAIKHLVEECRKADMLLMISCRRLDYVGELDMGIVEQVEIAPLDPLRIRKFVNAYIISKPEGKGDELFWGLAGGELVSQAWQAWEKAGASFELFWSAEDVPKENPNVYSNTTGDMDRAWREAVHNQRSMISLARNPFMLFMMTQVFSRENRLPENRGKLFERFVDFLLLQRENLSKVDSDALKTALSNLGFEMQQQGEGTAFDETQVLNYLNTVQLYQAKSANILSGQEQLRFSHQLLQEYHAAKRLDREMQSNIPAHHFFPLDSWWKPQGWEETAILMAGLYSSDTSPVIEWLRDAQPELTARCILESGAASPLETIQALAEGWLPRLTHESENPQARAAVGRALGALNLDTRAGLALRPDGLPDIAWGKDVQIGTYKIGGDEAAVRALPAQEIQIAYSYCLAKYPVTMAQFQAFLDDKDTGFEVDEWWDDFPDEYKKQAMRNQNNPYPNHPRENVTWYQAVAFCRWLTVKYHEAALLDKAWEIRLPSQEEWEIAARYPDGRFFSYGNEEDISAMNVDDTGIGQTNAVGIFPAGRNSALDLEELAGNVFEWTLSKYKDGGTSIDASGERRTVRGGSFIFDTRSARAASRNDSLPNSRFDYYGFRVCAAPIGVLDR